MVKRKEGEEKEERTGEGREGGDKKTKDGKRGGVLFTHSPPFQIVLCIMSYSFLRDSIILYLSNYKCFMFSLRLSFYYVKSMPLNPAARCKYWLSCMVNCFHVCFDYEHICSIACFFLRESIVPSVKKESWQICSLLTSAKSLGTSLCLDTFLC